ncbi:hypothetical protein ACIPY3_00920 [Paenarthrobacter sp. NPDC089714]|uniref:hypothetical protein n=1 Tax=Paenarthrobacter sp. NPDC089714 TaxID=3364377 RepID=UPI00382AE5A2
MIDHDNVVVEYDGHLWRGRPPQEIFQEIKGNYGFLMKPFFQRIGATDKMIEKWIDNQLSRQFDALPPVRVWNGSSLRTKVLQKSLSVRSAGWSTR